MCNRRKEKEIKTLQKKNTSYYKYDCKPHTATPNVKNPLNKMLATGIGLKDLPGLPKCHLKLATIFQRQEEPERRGRTLPISRWQM